MRKLQNDWEIKSRKMKLERDPESIRNNEANRKKLSRNKQRK